MLQLTGTQTAVAIIIGVIGAVLGYVLSESDRRTLGRTPWGIPSLAWGLIWLISWLIGLILYLIAHRAGVKAAGGSNPPRTTNSASRAPSVPTASDFPAYPRPASAVSVPTAASAPPAPADLGVGGGPGLVTGSQQPASIGSPVPKELPPPAWHPDPSGRFHVRWWTGSQWTSYVSTGGQVWTDTSPDQRIGPY